MTDGKWERQLVNALRAAERGSMRAPSSGSATDTELPDVLAGRPLPGTPELSVVWAIELKSTRGERIYVPKSEVQKLQGFTETFGGTAYIGARFIDNRNTRHYYLIKPDELRTTEKSYVVEKGDVEERAAWRVDATGGVVDDISQTNGMSKSKSK